jgi:hypothetical protein
MNREDHFREAERLLKGGHPAETAEEADARIAAAQVHATLALAAEPARAKPRATRADVRKRYEEIQRSSQEARIARAQELRDRLSQISPLVALPPLNGKAPSQYPQPRRPRPLDPDSDT